MKCKDILDVIERDYPRSYAMDWDNVGLLVGSYEQEINTVYVAVDATDEVIADAVDKQADLLVTHHPMIFDPISRVNEEDFIGRRVIELIRNKISYYAMHTNYDVGRMAELAGTFLGLTDPEVLEVTTRDPEEKGIGEIADLANPISLGTYCDRVKKAFGLDFVRVFGDLDTTIRRVAIVPGSGKSEIEYALEKQADVLVTGDIGHHAGIDAVAQGLTIIDAGHYGVENIFITDMAAWLRKHLPGLVVFEAPVKHPFKTV